jgi:hypothetical protein
MKSSAKEYRMAKHTQRETKEPKKSVFETLNTMLFGKTNAKAKAKGAKTGTNLLTMFEKK